MVEPLPSMSKSLDSIPRSSPHQKKKQEKKRGEEGRGRERRKRKRREGNGKENRHAFRKGKGWNVSQTGSSREGEKVSLRCVLHFSSWWIALKVEGDTDDDLILWLACKHWVLPLKIVDFIVCELCLHKAEREINTSNRNGKNSVAGDQDRKKCNPFSLSEPQDTRQKLHPCQERKWFKL